MIRRYGPAPVLGKSYQPRHGAYAILPRGASLLLTVQQSPGPEIQLPGGGIDPGESPVQALHREVLEETGWRIAAPRWFTTFRRFTYMPEYDIWAEKICHIYVAHPARELSAPTEIGHAATWMHRQLARECLANSGDRASVDRFTALR